MASSLKRIILLALAAITLLGLGALTLAGFYLNSAFFRDRMLAYANERLDGSITAAAHRFAPFGGRLRLSALELRGPDGRLLLRADRASAEISYAALLRKTVYFEHIALERGFVDLAFDERDRLRLAQLVKDAQPSAPRAEKGDGWQVVVADLNVRDSTVAYHRPARQWAGQAAGIDLRGRFDPGRTSGRLRLTADHIAWQGPDRAGRYDRPEIEADFQPEAENPLRLAAAVAGSRVAFAGEFQPDARQPRLRGALDFDVDLPRVRAWLPASIELGGRAAGRLTVNGLLFDPDADLSITLLDGRVAAVPFERLEVKAGLRQRRVAIERLYSRAPWGESTASGEIDLRPVFKVDLRGFEEAPAPYRLNLTAEGIQPALIPVFGWTREGVYNADVRAEGRGWAARDRSGRAQLALNMQKAKAVEGGAPLDGALTAELEWAGQTLSVVRSRLALGPNRADLVGRFDFQQGRLDARADLSLERLGDLGPGLGIELPAGRGTLHLTASGALARPSVQARIEAHDITYSEWQAQHLAAEMRLAPDGVLSIDRLDLQKDKAGVTGSGHIGLLDSEGALRDSPPISAALKLRNLSPADLGLSQVQGALNGFLEVGRTLFDPSAHLRLSESTLIWGPMTLDARGAAEWQSGRLTVHELILERARSNLRLAGSVAWLDSDGAWHADPVIDARLQTRQVRLQDIAQGYSGKLAVDAEVRGRPGDLSGRFNISGGALDLKLEKIDTFSAEGRLSGARIEVQKVVAVLAPGEVLRGHGAYGWDQGFELALDGDDIDLSNLRFLKAAGPVQGRLRLHVAGNGTLQAPQIEAVAAVSGPKYREQAFDDFHAEARLTGRRLELSADLNFHLASRVDLEGGDFEIEADFARTDLTPYLTLAAGKLLSGRMTGSLDLAGNMRAPLSLNGRLDLAEIRVTYQETPLVSAQAVHIGMRDGVVDVPAVQLDLAQRGYLELKAGGDLRRDFAARVQGRLPLAALSLFSESLGEAEGAVVLRAQAGGPLERLEWQAEIQFDQAGFVIPELLQSVQDLNGSIRLGADALSVENLAGRIETGSFTLNGRVELRDWQPVGGRLALRAQALPLYWPDTADFLVSGELDLTGTAQQARLAGDVVLLEGVYYKDFRLNLLAAIADRRRAELPSMPAEKPEWMRRIALSIDLSHRYPFMVDNNIAQLTIAPDFKIGGTLAAPLISGRAAVVEGEIVYRRKSFDVTRGVVDFVNPYRNEPNLDIAAETTIGKYDVGLSVSGTPAQLAFTLNSDPPLSDNDILSLILVGRTSEELSAGGGGPSTGQMLSSLLATAWGEDIRQRTGVDILEVETGAQSGEPRQSEDRIQVTVGKRLSPRLTIKYEVETAAGERVQRAVSEYRFMENIFAKGFQDTEGKYGGEMLFRLEFR